MFFQLFGDKMDLKKFVFALKLLPSLIITTQSDRDDKGGYTKFFGLSILAYRHSIKKFYKIDFF